MKRFYGHTGSIDADGRLIADVLCRRCAYNLRGLPRDGACPECGAAVERSLFIDRLRFRDPVWVARLAVGAAWATRAVMLAGVALGAACVAYVVTMGRPAWRDTWLAIFDYLVVLIPAACGAMGLYGMWRFTTPDPLSVGRERPLAARRLTRVGTLAALGLGGFLYATNVALPAVQSLLIWSIVAVAVAAMIALFTHARNLALRVTDLFLADDTRVIMIGLLVAGTMVAIDSLPGRIMTRLDAFTTLALFRIMGGMGLLVLSIFGVILVFRFRVAMREAAEGARATWEEEQNEVNARDHEALPAASES
jgi:hypothetical protein